MCLELQKISTNRQTRMTSALGAQLLEFSLVSILLLTLVFGAFDINRALQSYTALQEGVRTSLRCVYTVNGECVSASTASPDPLFNWYQVSSSLEPWAWQYDYRGDEYFIRKPVYTISNYTAEVLDSVSFDYNYSAHAFEMRTFPTEGDINQHVWMAAQPYIFGIGSDDFTRRNNPQFRYMDNRGRSYPVLSGATSEVRNPTTEPQDVIEGIVPTPRTIGRVSFTLPTPVSDPTNCRRARPRQFNNFPGSSAPDPGDQSCSSEHMDQQMRVILHVKGINRNEGSNTRGVVEMHLRRPDGTVVDLGGVQVTGSVGGVANFCPRGSTSAYVDPEFSDPAVCNETTDYSGLLKDLQMGETYTLIFKLRSVEEGGNHLDTNGEVRWEFSALDIYGPNFGDITEVEECEQSLLPSQMAAMQGLPPHQRTCATVHGRTATNRTWSPDGVMNPETPTNRSSVGPVYAWTSASDIRSAVFGSAAMDYFYQPGFPQPAQGTLQKECPTNLGVPGSAGHATLNWPSSAANAICPVSLPPASGTPQPLDPANPVGTPIVTTAQWSLDLNHPVPGEVNWTRQSCAEDHTQVAKPASVTAYHNHSDGEVVSFEHFSDEVTPSDVIHTGENDPHSVIATTEYSCGEYAGRSFEIGNQEYDSNFEETVFDGYHEDLGCTWEEQLHTTALSLGLSPAAYFAVERARGAKDFELTGTHDECSTHYDPGTPDAVVQIPGGPFPEGITPAECQAPNSSCYKSFVGFAGSHSGGELLVDTDAAASDYGFREIAAAYPAARFGCSGEDCVNLNVNVQTDAAGHTTFTSQGAIQVPLNLLLGQSIELEYSERERWEGNYAR